MFSRLQKLKATSPVDLDPEAVGKPILVADGNTYSIPRLDHPVDSTTAYVLGVNDKHFERLTTHLQAETVHFYEMRVKDLGLLSGISRLRHLAIRWNTKVQELSFLTDLPGLVTLVLEDTPKLLDLTPIGDLSRLKALEYSGGIWNKNRAHSLTPISRLAELEELQLLNLRVEDRGLRPLAKCKSLKKLSVSNQFPTEDYAYLSVHLPGAECSMFAPFVQLASEIDGKDVMVVGKRKPFLNSKEDKGRLQRYERSFRKLQEQFAADGASV